jgi:hypothetical protein
MPTYQSRCRVPEQQLKALQECLRGWGFLVGMLLTLGVAPDFSYAEPPPPLFDYTPNPIHTTPYGPAQADIVLNHPNFVPCFGGPIALCYYSGPEPNQGEPDLSCVVTEDGEFANCRCVEIPLGIYKVDINGILDKEIYQETVKKCGESGADCQNDPNMAPVCAAIENKQFLPDAVPTPDIISTFSLALASDPGFGIGQTNCPQEGDPVPYAGCMTAPCVHTDETFSLCNGEVCNDVSIDICTCPNFTGKYQVGQDSAMCNIGNGDPGANIWSAAFNPTVDKISQVSCAPDAFGNSACPLLPPLVGSDPKEPVIPEKPKNISCGKVCAEYRDIQNGVEVGFTCDATLCTVSPLTDDLLVEDACSGLGDGNKGISEILKLELEIGCSCCASQICGCEPSQVTNDKILELNERQRAKGIEPQCDYNGSLCGGL